MTIREFIEANTEHENTSVVIAMLKFCEACNCPKQETCDDYCLKADMFRDSLPL